MLNPPTIIDYDASQHPISKVTVFQRDRAEVCAHPLLRFCVLSLICLAELYHFVQITRDIHVSLVDGLTNIEVKNLPNRIDRDSITVEGTVHGVVLDVIYRKYMIHTMVLAVV